MSEAAASIVARRLRERPETTFLLPTGATPLETYKRLVAPHRSEALSFARATFFNFDEYPGLPHGHPASYHVYMRDNLYGLVDADPDRVPDGAAPDPQAECERYEAAIREAGGIDVCVLWETGFSPVGGSPQESPGIT